MSGCGAGFRFFGDASEEPTLNEPAMKFLDTVSLAPRAHLPAGLLSHGEKRQLELAIALATAPKLLLLDEPLAGTGHEESRRVIEVLRRLKGRYAMVLSVRGLQAVYGAAQVLFDVTFEVAAGEVVTLLGRNGMGKTTTIRSIMGL